MRIRFLFGDAGSLFRHPSLAKVHGVPLSQEVLEIAEIRAAIVPFLAESLWEEGLVPSSSWGKEMEEGKWKGNGRREMEEGKWKKGNGSTCRPNAISG